ncbi:MAG: hypothetical protein HN778_03305 [Prolixibacteraceae bacterium]|jgi:hypothetical protein|nr:hypothetical protein [Prolixibacteraceae bacterium]MBT6764492.1 hypothetical protein [Prolixibacteraceae bacterium]MBT7000476.1 hypothetical protein [Prolixibacteraceae bacterium]MBT7393840.1 hypothetical protein [Prolixibacteraceae bacterium]
MKIKFLIVFLVINLVSVNFSLGIMKNSGYLEKLKREFLISNSQIPENIIFVVRNQYKQDHHNTATIFQTGEVNTQSFEAGASLKILNVKTGKTSSLLETKTGVIRDPEVSFGGKKIIFSYRKNIDDNYHIYEIGSDGKNLKQLTFALGISDIDPLYLPNNQIIFSSTREPKYCMCNRHIMANLYRMNPDGSNIVQLGKSTLFEGHSALLNDGRIIYDRWEYVDRNFGDAQGLWTMNPDGTKHAIYYGNNTNSPGGIIDPRPLPESNLILCIFGSCHDRPWGALTLLDRSKGVDGKDAVVKIWPEKAIDLIGKGNWDTFMQLDVRYEDPFPLSNTAFLVSKSKILKKKKNDHPEIEKMGIYLLDTEGNETLLYEDKNLSCFDPMPLTPRFLPREIPTTRKFDESPGYFYVQNVYEGTHMDKVEPGSVKYLRVVESPEKRTFTQPSWNGQGQQAPGVNWHSFENKRVLGIVPVESDGSAYFEAPSGKFLFFQLLDEKKKMVQSMRSGVIVHPGETNGCIGCHEDRLSVPPVTTKMPLAMRKKPHKLSENLKENLIFSYTRDLQPIFDKHCIECHDFGKEAGEKLLLAGDRNPYFNASYIDIHLKKQIASVGGGPAEIQQAFSWGSHPSNLVKVIEKGHHKVNLSQEEMETIYLWIDLNGIYYPEYESAYPDNPAGRSPLTFEQLKRLGELTGVNFSLLADHQRKLGPQISFERPELSPCLLPIQMKGAEYLEALAIIEAGKIQLEKVPRADMEGFEPCEEQQVQLKKYMNRLKVEKENNKAVSEGNLIYDKKMYP